MVHFEFFLVWSCHILIISSSRLLEKIEQFFEFRLSSFKCSQIWLIPRVDDIHCGYITKLKYIYIYIYILLTAWWQPESAFSFSLAKCHLKGKINWSDFWWFESPRQVENNTENRQFSILGFLYGVKTIEGWINNCISYLVYSRIWLILSRDNLHFFYGGLPLWLHQKNL